MSDKSLAGYMYPQIEQLEKELISKQNQLNCLMRITQAINANMAARDLFDMYSQFLQTELGVKRLAVLFREKDGWACKKAISFKPDHLEDLVHILVRKYKDFSKVGELSHDLMKQFELVIPVFHKDDPLAYVLIGDLEESNEAYDRFKFMITITNVVAVAIENKRLFNRQIEQEAYNKEMELAKNVQQMLIPTSLPKEEHFELSSIYRPHSNIGGDYFDYCKFDDGSFVICMADVSGKGISAALLMANFQATLRSALRIYDQLDDLVQHLNKTIVETTKSERIITFFILKYHNEKNVINYVNAGHNPPIYISGDKKRWLRDGCTILGAEDYLKDITVGEIEMGNEETFIVLYTDGLTDLRDGSGSYFDEDLIANFACSHRNDSATNFNKKLLEELEHFKGKQAYPDDIAVLTAKIKPLH
ncbi:MAG: SpoIIE family protein phosphatase [Saprospiraceae bacterium]|nr:SpoIIE family protein phosphatase [Saprospiraceae bacterium]